MAQVTADLVKQLREQTGVGMMECKKALTENEGSIEKAVLWLRERGLSRAASKSGRTTAEGAVGVLVSQNGKEAVLVEMNCETDFSAKNGDFVNFVSEITKLALSSKVNSVEKLAAMSLNGTPVSEALTTLIQKVGENMQLRRVKYLSVPNGLIAGYSHMGGKIGTLAVFEGESSEKVMEVAKDVAMHIAAVAPKYLKRDEVPTAEVELEKDLSRKKLLEEGKPADKVEMILAGQVNKYFQEICLVDQPFVKEQKFSVSKYVESTGIKAGLTAFARFQLGEGIERNQVDFAAEVAAQLKN
jgi:elongation factor Ts